MPLTHFSNKDAQALIMEINMIQGANELMNGKCHKFFSHNLKKIQEVQVPFYKEMDVLKSEYKATVVKDEASGRDVLKFESDEVEEKYRKDFDSLMSKPITVELLKLDEADLDKFAIPSKFAFSSFYKYMVG